MIIVIVITLKITWLIKAKTTIHNNDVDIKAMLLEKRNPLAAYQFNIAVKISQLCFQKKGNPLAAWILTAVSNFGASSYIYHG